jgi:hypothetical protein
MIYRSRMSEFQFGGALVVQLDELGRNKRAPDATSMTQ